MKLFNYTDHKATLVSDLTIEVNDKHYTIDGKDTHPMRAAIDYVDPFKLNRRHVELVLSNVTYRRREGMWEALLANEYLIQRSDDSMPLEEFRLQTEQVLITMEEYRQYRCHKTILTTLATDFMTESNAAIALANMHGILKPKGEDFIIVFTGFIDESGTIIESGSVINSKGELEPSILLIPETSYHKLMTVINTYVVRG